MLLVLPLLPPVTNCAIMCTARIADQTVKIYPYSKWWSGNSSVVECWTHGQRVMGLSPGKVILFSRINFLFWLFFRYLFHPGDTTGAGKRSQSFCPRVRWQDTAKHTCTLCMWFQMKWHCKRNTRWDSSSMQNMRWDSSSFKWHQLCNNPTVL